MDIKEEIEELKNKISELEEKVKEENINNANNAWKPKYNGEYYFINLDRMIVDFEIWTNSTVDNRRLRHKIVFKELENAEEYLEYLEEKEKYMNTFTEEKWKDGSINKYYYDYENECVDWDTDEVFRRNGQYFKRAEEVLVFMQKYEWQIKHELGGD